jgi:hypothetical protein
MRSGAASAGDGRAGGKSWRSGDLFRLPEMTSIVRGNDEEPCRNTESHKRQEWVLEPGAIRIDRRGLGNQLPCEIVSGTITIQNQVSILHRRWLSLAWRTQPACDRRFHRSHELSAQVARLCRFPARRSSAARRVYPAPDRGAIDEVYHSKVIQALRDAPTGAA